MAIHLFTPVSASQLCLYITIMKSDQISTLDFNNVVNAFGHSFNSKDSIKGKLLCVFPGQFNDSGTSLAGSIMSD